MTAYGQRELPLRNGAGLAPRANGGSHPPAAHRNKKAGVTSAERTADPIEKKSPPPSRGPLASAAAVLWLIAASITLQNLGGFLGSYGDAFITGRETASTQRTLLFDRLARLRQQRKEIVESRSTGEITIAIRNASAKKIDDERLALQQARRRDQIDADLATIEQTVGNSPNLSQADPSAATIAGVVNLLTAGRVVIADDLFRRLRLLALIALPLFAGPILGLGTATLAGERRP